MVTVKVMEEIKAPDYTELEESTDPTVRVAFKNWEHYLTIMIKMYRLGTRKRRNN